jgi:hypothetical protein
VLVAERHVDDAGGERLGRRGVIVDRPVGGLTMVVAAEAVRRAAVAPRASEALAARHTVDLRQRHE